MGIALWICVGIFIYMLASFVILAFADMFELPTWAEYALAILCFPWIGVWCLGYLIQRIFHCDDEDED